MYTTVPVYAILPEGKLSTGTGFIFSVKIDENTSIPLLITNYHVVKNARNGFVEMHISENNRPTKEVVRVLFEGSVFNDNKLGDLDLIALPIASAINNMQAQGKQLFFRSIDESLIPKKNLIDELASVEDLTFIGYPSSIYDSINKLPVIRQGISATPIWNDFQGKEEFLIDAGVFPGSSGSPVLIFNRGTYPTKDGIAIGNRILFVGVLKETLKREEDGKKDYLDLGVVINCIAFQRELAKLIFRMTGKHIA